MRDSRALTPWSLTLQQMQPFWSSSHSVVEEEFCETVRDFSMLEEEPNSLRRTAIFFWWFVVRMWFRRVVLPAPR